MPLRNMWSLRPGEVFTAEKILAKISGCQVYFPLHDVGIDLLVVKGQKLCSVQVKESRYYDYPSKEGPRSWSWHQVRKSNLNPSATSQKLCPHFFVFVVYVPKYAETARDTKIEKHFICIPTPRLKEMAKNKGASKDKEQEGKQRDTYSFNFSFDLETRKVFDIQEKWAPPRGEAPDYSEFWNNWGLIEQFLSK